MNPSRAVCLSLIVLARVAAAAAGPSERAAELLNQAIVAGLAGEADQKDALLAEALDAAPDFAPARWQAGQVRYLDEWLPVAEAQRRAAADPRQLERWQSMLDWQESTATHLQAARWCRKHELDDEARYHWAKVVQAEPNHEEALKALGMEWYGGRLVECDRARELRDQQREVNRRARKFRTTVAGWKKRVASGDPAEAAGVLAEIRAFDQLELLPAAEEYTLGAEPRRKDDAAAHRRIGVALVAALEKTPEHDATVSIVRHALHASSDQVRAAARYTLAKRSWHDFVPGLLDIMSGKIKLWQSVRVDPSGAVFHQIEAEQQTRRADVVHAYDGGTRTIDLEGTTVHWWPAQDKVMVEPRQQSRADSARFREALGRTTATAVRRGADAEQVIAQENQRREAVNRRVIEVLTEVTGQELGDDPEAWWDWWQSYNEYEREERPRYYRREADTRYVYYRPPIVVTHPSCFVAGTPVWTKTGQRPIDSLRPGDLVLSQDVDSGELRFQPVLDTTLRPPSPIIRAHVGDEVISMTKGHPAWVIGEGWRMAKELDAGQQLHTMAGSVELGRLATEGEAEAYNLVVGGFGTYFVGDVGLLVHDNTPRTPTLSKIPGWSGRED